jgi:hypothetical protein
LPRLSTLPIGCSKVLLFASLLTTKTWIIPVVHTKLFSNNSNCGTKSNYMLDC